MAFNGRFLLHIAHFAAQQGADFQALLALSGRSLGELSEESCTVSDSVYNAVIEQAIAQTGDPFFGLHLGESQNLSAAGLVLQISQSCETVKQALAYCCQFSNLGCSALPLALVEEKHYYKLTLSPNEWWQQQSPIAVRQTTDGFLAFSLREFHSLTRRRYRPIAIQVSWPAPADLSEYQRVFDCPLDFNQPEIAVWLRKEHVEEKVITSDHRLLRILVAHAEEKSAQLKAQQGFAAVVRQAIVNLLSPEFPSIEQVAGHLNTSLRTLQRRLQDENYTYKLLIDELRQEFALSYLKRSDLSISEIAYLLNYADNSAFTRSFKRWTGKTPNVYREEVMLLSSGQLRF
ncbi:MAG TPA: AraC family transcriptional regulator [Saprospiraceae bacterium]|nr:AraC family transcriptional regulator [Saprospiraceae bacterium]HMQ85921.1 AraC family transcriptional regulator [Saprospiraceae bacterium]